MPSVIPEYRINGYEFYQTVGLVPDGDKTTADSFEKPNVGSRDKYEWDEGIVEYNFARPAVIAPRVFVFKGHMVVAGLTDYVAAKSALVSLLADYVTLEAVHLGVKANAVAQTDGISWHRLTDLNGQIVVAVEIKFDELLQTLAFKDQSAFSLYVNDDMDLLATTAAGSLNKFSLVDGHLILTV